VLQRVANASLQAPDPWSEAFLDERAAKFIDDGAGRTVLALPLWASGGKSCTATGVGTSGTWLFDIRATNITLLGVLPSSTTARCASSLQQLPLNAMAAARHSVLCCFAAAAQLAHLADAVTCTSQCYSCVRFKVTRIACSPRLTYRCARLQDMRRSRMRIWRQCRCQAACAAAVADSACPHVWIQPVHNELSGLVCSACHLVEWHRCVPVTQLFGSAVPECVRTRQ
jgi:hypothetical protein